MNDGGGNGASCVGIKVRTDTTKLSDMVIARFGDGRNLIREGKMFILCLSYVYTPLSLLICDIEQRAYYFLLVSHCNSLSMFDCL